jgi:DNA-nicking Smr family endonuclease
MTRRPHDFELWQEVAKSVKPLRKGAAAKKTMSPRMAPLTKLQPGGVVAVPVHKRPSHPKPKSPPPLSGFDRRTSQKLTRGNVEIESRIDLHGTGIEMARLRLHRFLSDAHGAGFRTVLVITGKGESPFARHTLHGASHFDTPERQGKLRRMVPDWLHEPEFRSLVSGFQPAHPKHGGGGAFYVRLRRLRGQP